MAAAPLPVSIPEKMPQVRSAFDATAFRPQLEQILSGDGVFQFAFQPIVDVRRSTVAGYEALVRFPELGMRPDVCFQAAEACGLRRRLERMVLTSALSQHAAMGADTFLSVNVSPNFVLSEDWDEALATTDSLRGIVMEITEQDSIEDYDEMRRRLQIVHAMGGSLAIDDTGAGYASLRHMMELRPNFLKLDRYFVGDCHLHPIKSTLIEMIGKAANRMNAWIVAEGVETSQELNELIRLNVPLVQGYHLARPDAALRTLTPEREEELRQQFQHATERMSLANDCEPCLNCHASADAASLLRSHPEQRYVVTLDHWGRPLRLLERNSQFGTREVSDSLRVASNTSALEAMQRALSRIEACRFDPLLLVNEQGQLQGIVRVDKLMRSLLQRK